VRAARHASLFTEEDEFDADALGFVFVTGMEKVWWPTRNTTFPLFPSLDVNDVPLNITLFLETMAVPVWVTPSRVYLT